MEITIDWNNRTYADHKRSYDSRRASFIEKDPAVKVSYPTYPEEFDTFQLYIREFNRQVKENLGKSIQYYSPKTEEAHVIITHTNGSFVGTYKGIFNDMPHFTIAKEPVVQAYFGPNFLTRAIWENNVKKILDHEVRHYIDTPTIQKYAHIYRKTEQTCKEEQKPALNKYTDLLYIGLIGKMRTEGFALRERKEKIRPSRVFQKLKEQREKLETLERIIDGKKHIGIKEQNVIIQEHISPYQLGNAFFELIAIELYNRDIERITNPDTQIIIDGEVHFHILRQIQERNFPQILDVYEQAIAQFGLKKQEAILTPKAELVVGNHFA